MTKMRQYIDLADRASQYLVLAETIAALLEDKVDLTEGELIPLPPRILRVPGAAFDFYQLLKITANPNLAHKVNYKPTGTGKAGANVTDIMLMYYDPVSYEETKRVFDHFKVPYTDVPELSSELGRTSGKEQYRSKLNPPSDADDLYGEYLKPASNPA